MDKSDSVFEEILAYKVQFEFAEVIGYDMSGNSSFGIVNAVSLGSNGLGDLGATGKEAGSELSGAKDAWKAEGFGYGGMEIWPGFFSSGRNELLTVAQSVWIK